MKQIIIRKNQAEIIVQRPEENNPQDRHSVLLENFSDKENEHTKKQIINALRNFKEYNISTVEIRNTATDLLEYIFLNFFDSFLGRGKKLKLKVHSAYNNNICDYDLDQLYYFMLHRAAEGLKLDLSCLQGVNTENCDLETKQWLVDHIGDSSESSSDLDF